MAMVHVESHVSSSELLAQERRTQHAFDAITSRGWRQRLRPLANHMAERRLIRARGVWSELLAQERRDAGRVYLIVAVTVQDAGPDDVAAELGLQPSRLVDELRVGVEALAREYEHAAWPALWEPPWRIRLAVAERCPPLLPDKDDSHLHPHC